MGKIADPLLKLRCVHCGNTETPLWRAGPDGPKTLCNACGVRYKKGKLTIFRDKDGNLTAVKQEDTLPVHVPPAPKKSNKKLQQHHAPDPPSKSDHSHPSSPSEPAVRRPVRKVPTEGVFTAALAKKPRSRSRRTNAGQLPGRYSSKSLPDDVAQWHSPLTSPKSFSSSPAQSPRNDGGVCFQLARGASALKIDDPLPYHCDPSDEALFPDVSCLGIDSGDDDRTTVKLLPMDADPSSAEQFSFAFGELGNNASVNIGLPDRVKALRGLVLDRTRKVSARYESTVVGLCRLCEERCLRSCSNGNGQPWTLEDCKNYVRWFSQEQTVGFVANKNSSCNPGISLSDSDEMDITAGFMLPEKTAYTSAVENLKALMDSSELAGFAEACMIELLCEDVAAALSKGVFAGKCAGVHFRLAQSSFPSNSIAVRG